MYPIKYAVQQLYVDGQIKGFIATKCYVKEDKISYLQNGSHTKSYGVSFPFSRFDKFAEHKKKEEALSNVVVDVDSLQGLQDVNTQYFEEIVSPNREDKTSVVNRLYDSYEDAKKDAVDKTTTMRSAILALSPSYDEMDILPLLRELKTNENLCNEYEKFITDRTSHMEITDTVGLFDIEEKTK